MINYISDYFKFQDARRKIEEIIAQVLGIDKYDIAHFYIYNENNDIEVYYYKNGNMTKDFVDKKNFIFDK